MFIVTHFLAFIVGVVVGATLMALSVVSSRDRDRFGE